MSKYLAIALIVIAFIMGVGGGYALSPEYRSELDKDMSSDTDLGEADKNLDLRYIDMMIAHHREAILLAEQVRDKTERSDVRNLAHEILKNEPKLIDELYGWKKDWYKNDRKVEDPEVVNLGSFDDKFDLRFLNTLIEHHERGLKMTHEAKIKSSRNEILNNADSVEQFLLNTKETLEEWRSEWYLNNVNDNN